MSEYPTKTVLNYVDWLISNSDPKRRRFFLSPELYRAFWAEVEPLYLARYGSMLADAEATADGYECVLYSGKAICLADEKGER